MLLHREKEVFLAALLVCVAAASCPAQEKAASESLSDIEVSKEPEKNLLGPQGTPVENGKYSVGGGMELIQVGGTNIVAPQGTRVTKEHGMVVYEDMGEFLGRRFSEIEERLAKVEETQKQLKETLQRLEKAIDEMAKRSLVSGK